QQANLYGAGDVVDVRAPLSGLSVTPGGGLNTYRALPLNTTYQVRSRVADDEPAVLQAAPSSLSRVPKAIRALYLQRAPDGQPESPRLRALAARITKGRKNNYDRAEALRVYIRDNCKYNLQAPAYPRDRDFVEYFLFESRQGYCIDFAAALTMLCRYASI